MWKEANDAPFGHLHYSLFPGAYFQHAPSLIPCAAALPSLMCAVWMENTLRAITSKLGFAWLQSPCCSLCCRLFPLVSSFKDQRKKFPEGRGQAQLERTENVSFLTCALKSFWFWCFLPSTKAAVPYFMGINSLLPLCLKPYLRWKVLFCFFLFSLFCWLSSVHFLNLYSWSSCYFPGTVKSWLRV